ncbi:hypothetical protein PR202_ga03238 [Eleusine coracana subsp. coracana]|uniref:Diphthine--ammonia ligase n=1 Tax=Eleusine coracana subsp. coracana TaxID=191504 RepID=A0AAV5BLU2_ELECO|nr:hypothetical protein PR202_ga03238 [Eleusine coracana subsp. coracana]
MKPSTSGIARHRSEESKPISAAAGDADRGGEYRPKCLGRSEAASAMEVVALIVALANLIPLDDAVDELDSYMYQTVGHQIVVSYAKCMGLPLFRRRIRGSTRDQGLKYNVTAGDEVEDMFALLSEIKRKIPSISAIASGAIASDYQRLRVESVCSRLGLIRRGIVAITVKVAALGLKPSLHLGKELAELKCHLLRMNEPMHLKDREEFAFHWVLDSGSHQCFTQGLKEDLVAVLSRIDNQLKKDGLGWVNVLYVHLYISSMKEFGLANEVYVSFITEKKCYLGVPSRSTIELPLVQVGLGKAYVEVLVSEKLVKRVLHVQSISCWAPSCIGPYSQATLYGEILYMAGQLGLDPPTMKLCSGGPTGELELALQNSEAVANAFSCSIYTSAIHFLVYCSAHLTSDEREEVEQSLQSSYITRLDCSKTGSYPTVLYVFAPDLPKGARVEIKPILYVPANDDSVMAKEMEAAVLQPVLGKAWSDWSAQYSDSDDSCCQLAKILLGNQFSWDSVTMLRFYYSVEHPLAADTLSRAFSEAFTELAEADCSLRIDEFPFYSIVPVSGSGRSASFFWSVGGRKHVKFLPTEPAALLSLQLDNG